MSLVPLFFINEVPGEEVPDGEVDEGEDNPEPHADQGPVPGKPSNL
jgi:hypothetical protein